MKIGIDYYPEHWDEKLWRQDADLMKQSGVKVVRLAEFSWSKLEPFAWQIDNELESNFCCCEHCTADYREWLKKKYSSLMEINKTYGNNVWSGEYSDWDQIIPPMGNYPYAWF